MAERIPVKFSDLPEAVQTVARWIVDQFVMSGRWPSQADLARQCHRLGIEGRELRDTYNFDLFDGTLGYPPRPSNRVRIRPWALRDLGVLDEAFDRALLAFREAVARIVEGAIDTVDICAADISPNRSPVRDLIGEILVERVGGTPSSQENGGAWSASVGLAELDRQPAMVDELLRRPERDALEQPLLQAPGWGQPVAGASDRYQIGEKLGTGGYADVWKAVDSLLRRPVAMKFVRRSAPYADTAVVHARTVAQVGPHPNVVTVFDVVEMADPATGEPSQGIVMELLEGPTLAVRLRGPAFSRLELVSIGTDLMSGVAEYHRRNMAHFDLHGANVILAVPNAKLVDPLFHDTAILGRTAALNGQQERDLRDLRDLLGEMLRHSDVRLDVVSEFERRTGANALTLDLLRREFSGAIERPASARSGTKVGSSAGREQPSHSPSLPLSPQFVAAVEAIQDSPVARTAKDCRRWLLIAQTALEKGGRRQAEEFSQDLKRRGGPEGDDGATWIQLGLSAPGLPDIPWVTFFLTVIGSAVEVRCRRGTDLSDPDGVPVLVSCSVSDLETESIENCVREPLQEAFASLATQSA